MKKILKNKSIRIGRIISTIITVVCVLLCFFITLEVIRANNEDRPPRILSISVSYVPTPSMEPTIHAGEYVAYKKVKYDDVQLGDIIVYKSKINSITNTSSTIVLLIIGFIDSKLITSIFEIKLLEST